MAEQAEDYPTTLLKVSKLAFSRPALGLRLLGVVESKGALTARIRHIVSRPFPTSALNLKLAGLALVLTGRRCAAAYGAGQKQHATRWRTRHTGGFLGRDGSEPSGIARPLPEGRDRLGQIRVDARRVRPMGELSGTGLSTVEV